jgi:spore coat protein U-like protein
MKKQLSATFFALALGLVISTQSQAATNTTTLNVGANVLDNCWAYTSMVDFGDFDGGEVNTNGVIHLICTPDVPYNIALDAGQNYIGSGWRVISDGTNVLPYGLFKTSGYAEEWGDSDYDDTYAYGSSLEGVGDGSVHDISIYARLFANGGVPSGYYSDVVNVTIHY